ncbi:MAG: heme ABC transporter ATP-binding protein [Labilithrix sp.]|nr:heme ABC transporter ATP-binding protein [Labilithrix sp.]
MIEAREVTRVAGRERIVDRVTLGAARGEVLALVGPNGAGKSTLLRMLAGDLAPTSGRIWMSGRLLTTIPRVERARVRAVLPQHSDLAVPLSCFDVVLVGRAPHVVVRETARDRAIVAQAMRATETSAVRERDYTSLSGGERQRVHAARALAQIWGSAETLLLLDEPTSSLDLSHQHALLDHVRRLAQAGGTVVCVLHDLNLAAQYADRVAVMHRGRLEAVGPPREILTAERLADVFAVDARVVVDAELGCPVIVSRGRVARRSPREQCDEERSGEAS